MSHEPTTQTYPNETKPNRKGFLSNLTKSAGAVSKLVSLQAERTKLISLTLPTAYRALGKDCIQQKRHLNCAPELTSQLQSVLAEIKQLAEVGSSQPVPQSLTDKAKAAGKHAVDAARHKQLSLKRDSLIANIGKVIFDRFLDESGPPELVGPIKSAIDRNAAIEEEISQLSKEGEGSVFTPKRILVCLAISGALFTAIVLRNSMSDTNADQSVSMANSDSDGVGRKTSNEQLTEREIDEIRKANKKKFVSARNLTRQEFIDKLHANSSRTNRINYCSFDNFAFQDIFGKPDSNIEYNTSSQIQRRFSYRCSDGTVFLTVNLHSKRTVISEIEWH